MANAATAKHAASSMILKLATSFLEDCVKSCYGRKLAFTSAPGRVMSTSCMS